MPFPQQPQSLKVTVRRSKYDKLLHPSFDMPVGDVYLTAGNSKETRLTASGLGTDPKAAPDGGMVAWIEAQVLSYEVKNPPRKNAAYPKLPMCFPKQMVVWRGGKVVSRFATEQLYGVAWKWVDANRIATASEGFNGPICFELWDARTGRRLDRRRGYDRFHPDWTHDLTDL